MAQNKHGLTRDIPSHIKREVRQRDGFGCVVCGKAFYHYEHFSPEFADATEHSAKGIILLCPTCHGKKKHFLSLETISRAANHPRAKQRGFSFEAFDVGNGPLTVEIGPLKAFASQSIIKIDGVNLFSVDRPEGIGGPFRVNASIYGKQGEEVFRIVNNEWQGLTSNWDLEVIGPLITIRSAKREIAMRLRSNPPSGIVVERLDLSYRDLRIQVEEGGPIRISRGMSSTLSSDTMNLFHCQSAIEVNGNYVEIGKGCQKAYGRISYNK